MTDSDVHENPLEGAMFLYEQPELLAIEVHGTLGLTKPDAPFAFTRMVRALPVTINELPSVQKHYPIIFSDLENPALLAVFGVQEVHNLFVDSNGAWDESSYIPAYLRCYPFTFARKSEDELAVVVDRAAASISDKPEVPFFKAGQLSKETQAIIDFCRKYEVDRRKTAEFCKRIQSLEILAPHRAIHKTADKEQGVAEYYAIDAKKLTKLAKNVIHQLFLDASLAAVYSHLFSLENWQRLVERRNRAIST